VSSKLIKIKVMVLVVLIPIKTSCSRIETVVDTKYIFFKHTFSEA